MDLIPERFSWEEIPCAWCSSEEYRVIFSGPDLMHHLPGKFTFVKCQKCGTYRQNPRLTWDSLKYFYPDTYSSYIPHVSEYRNPIKRIDKRYGSWKRMRAIERYQPGGHLLDVGCGTGLLMEEALRSGRWKVTGIEPNERAAAYVRKKLDVPVIVDTFSNAVLEPETFDVIVFWNVLEHSYQPIKDLRYAQQILKPGGWIVIGIPSVEGWERRLFGSAWVGWELPRHLYLFPKEALKNILQSLGFRWQAARCISSSHAVLGLSLDFWSQRWQHKYPGLRKVLMNTYNSMFGRILFLPPLWLSDKLNQSTLIAIFAQKI